MKHSIKKILSISCLFTLISTSQLLAGDGFPVPLREGPGTHYAKIGKILPQQVVKIGVCNPSWCHVSTNSRSGWAPTAQVNPKLARLSNQKARAQSAQALSGGGSAMSPGRGHTRLQASTSMTVSMRIIPNNETRKQSTILPFPVPARLQAATR